MTKSKDMTHRWRLFFFLLMLCGLSCKSQPVTSQAVHQPRKMMQEIIDIARTTSLYSARVDWEALTPELMGMAEGVLTVEELKPALEHLLNAMGDHHAGFRKTGTYEMVAHFTAWRELQGRDTRERNSEIHGIVNDVNGKFSFQKLDDDIGYLQVRGISPAVPVHPEAEPMRRAIRELHDQGVTRWIVDLRYNGGGNMSPMLAGLAPLIGEGPIGGAVNAQGETNQEYSIRKGQFYNWDRLMDTVKTPPLNLGAEKVAVLLSRYTVSSGELVGVAFKGRKNTRFFGEASGGLTTVTGWDVIQDALVMSIAKSIYVDRNQIKYEKNVPVDQATNFDPNLPLSADEGVQAATTWLRQ